MTSRPPIRRWMRMLLLAVAFVAASCGSVPPPRSPAATGSPGPTGSTAPSATAGAPAGAPFANLLTLSHGDLLLVDSDGRTRSVSGPGERIEAASAARGTIVARTAGPVFHMATVPGADVDRLSWRELAIDPSIARRPLSEFALSPAADRLAILAAEIGSGEPFEVVVVDLETAATRVVPVDREPNGPPVWLDSSTVLLEVIASAASGSFLRLGVDSGVAGDVKAQGIGPSIAGDGTAVAVLAAGREPTVHVLPVSDWIGGAAPETGEAVTGQVDALHVALDATGRRVAFDAADADGTAASLSVYARDVGGWSVGATIPINGEPPRWFGWIR
ncbi:MAG TPA: hypothetical protein VFO73_02675 [Candidatus Limnocylindrales bacterium]|nr:hypothetical protein [Candidatus Limnocylindrales bacterium]